MISSPFYYRIRKFKMIPKKYRMVIMELSHDYLAKILFKLP